MIVVQNDDNSRYFTEEGDSGALVTGVGEDRQAYAVHMSFQPCFNHGGAYFPASIMCRLDTSLQLLAQECGLNLDMVESLSDLTPQRNPSKRCPSRPAKLSMPPAHLPQPPSPPSPGLLLLKETL